MTINVEIDVYSLSTKKLNSLLEEIINCDKINFNHIAKALKNVFTPIGISDLIKLLNKE
jgi:hypothetical protein